MEGQFQSLIKFLGNIFSPSPQPPQPNIIGDPTQAKLTTTISPNFRNEANDSQQSYTPQQHTLADNPTDNDWESHFQTIYDESLKQRGLGKDVERLLVTSENGKENPGLINPNNNNTADIGLLQVNTNPQDQARVKALQDPQTNINAGLDIYKQRLQNLGDPLLALSSYNLGARGAVNNPQQALSRAQSIYQNAKLQMPQTPFAQNPAQFIQQHMDQYKQLGIAQ